MIDTRGRFYRINDIQNVDMYSNSLTWYTSMKVETIRYLQTRHNLTGTAPWHVAGEARFGISAVQEGWHHDTLLLLVMIDIPLSAPFSHRDGQREHLQSL